MHTYSGVELKYEEELQNAENERNHRGEQVDLWGKKKIGRNEKKFNVFYVADKE